jgi:hypothetical protein
MSESRNDASMRHFQSRAQQKSTLPNLPKKSQGHPEVRLTFVFDQPFGSISDDIERNKYLYVGTSNRPDRISDMIMSRRLNCASICGEKF